MEQNASTLLWTRTFQPDTLKKKLVKQIIFEIALLFYIWVWGCFHDWAWVFEWTIGELTQLLIQMCFQQFSGLLSLFILYAPISMPHLIKFNQAILFHCYFYVIFVITIPLVFSLPLEIELFQYCHQFCVRSFSNHARIQYFNIPISASTSIAAFSTILEELWVFSPKRVTHLGITILLRCFLFFFFEFLYSFELFPKTKLLFK